MLGLLPTPLPSSYTYLNLGTVKDKGFELGVEAVVTRDVNVFVNYSYQADPVIEGFDPARSQRRRPTTASTPASTSATAASWAIST